jgi:transcriptional regulator with XRE-family HTH domain
MAKKTPDVTTLVADQLTELGQQIRLHRKQMRISATVAAEAAGMSRATFHRIEKGEPSVTMGAYLNAMAALGLDFGIIDLAQANRSDADLSGMIPVRINLADYPQLKKLAWQVHGTDTLTPAEALSIYERNWRYLDEAALEPAEQQLIEALRLGLGGSDAAV